MLNPNGTMATTLDGLLPCTGYYNYIDTQLPCAHGDNDAWLLELHSSDSAEPPLQLEREHWRMAWEKLSKKPLRRAGAVRECGMREWCCCECRRS